MSNDRYVPRSYSIDSLDFGLKERIRWKGDDQLTNVELDQRDAAIHQHAACFRIRQTIVLRHGSLLEYCRFVDANPARFGRMLRGEVIMRLEDIANAERNLGMKL